MLTASLELGARHDGGDAETGFGADIGTSLALAAPPRELSAELRACGLLAQEADSLSRRGLSGTLAIDPAPDSERGLSLSLSQTVGGPASGGAGALLERPTLAGLGAETEEARLGYGLGVFEGRYTATPELGLGLSDTDREVRLGWRLAWAYLWLDPASWRPGQRGHGTCRYRDECPPARRPGGEASEYRRVARPRHHWAHPSSGCADPC